MLNNLKKFGRTKNFDQNITLNYTIPFDKIPVTDWLGADYRYQVNYNWRAGPVNIPDAEVKPGDQDIPDDLDFKNIIQNSKVQNLTGRVDLVKLYNKVKFLKEINTPPKPKAQPTRKSTNPTVKPPPDTVKTTPPLIKGLAKLIMSVHSINGSYERTEGTILPGYSGTPKFLGMDENWKSPGWSFVLGGQDPNIRYDLANKNYITKNSGITTPYSQTRNENFNLRANIEPATDLKIQVDIRKEVTNSYQEIFRYDTVVSEFASLNPNRSGSYRISFNTIKTAFTKSNDQVESSVFKQFEENLLTIQERFKLINNNGSGELYDTTSQDVIIPAFIAAYGGKNAQTIGLGPFPKIPLPNWRFDYTGLSKLEMFNDLFQTVTISHGYTSTYSVSNYSNSLNFTDKDDLAINRSVQDYNTNYFGESVDGQLIPVYVISQVLITEQFNPLVGISVRTKSRVTANLQYKTKRDLALNISNAQVTELTSKDVSFEMGYTKTGMKLPFKAQGRLVVLKNDLAFRLNVTVADQKTIQRKINELNVITNGNLNYQMRPNISYTVSKKLTIQMYYERTINQPLVSNSFRRSTTRFGIQVRFSLAQ